MDIDLLIAKNEVLLQSLFADGVISTGRSVPLFDGVEVTLGSSPLAKSGNAVAMVQLVLQGVSVAINLAGLAVTLSRRFEDAGITHVEVAGRRTETTPEGLRRAFEHTINVSTSAPVRIDAEEGRVEIGEADQ